MVMTLTTVTLGEIHRLLQVFLRLQGESMDECSVPGPSTLESRALERCVEVGRAAGVLPSAIAVGAVLLVEDPGRLLEIGSHLATILQKGTHPVVVLPVLVDRLLHAWRYLQMELP